MSRSAETAPNRLAREKSPYLLQHAHNPVDWFPWGAEALERARNENKPIFLSVGYSACHWCHVMERESFEDAATAEILNAHFVPVKVDREERPDVDEIYMTAVQMMTRHGGWPMSVFLLPDGRPFYGGTYFPPRDSPGRIGFKTLLNELARAWRERRGEIEQVAQNLTDDLQKATRQRPTAAPAGGAVSPNALLGTAIRELAERFDEARGGFGPAPKFPPHHALALLVEAVRRGGHDEHDENGETSRMLTRTLDCMGAGGVYDHVGGGFHRYATDADWLVPHFEKMLYDNALLARVYAGAFQVTGREAYARLSRETCDWVVRDMTDEMGGFHAAIDADSEGEEGKYYVWTEAEVKETAGEPAGSAFCAGYNFRPGGNFRDEATGRATGTNIPHRAAGNLPHDLPGEITRARQALLSRRHEQRVPPGKDDKVITAWNGLMIGALAYAGQVLGEDRYIAAAARAADFCLTTLRPNGEKLLRRYRDGEAALDAYLDDYACLADGLLDLFEASGETRWADAARGLADTLLSRFWDAEDGGFFFTGTGHETLIARSKELFDGATPSPNGVAARVLARLGNLPGGDAYREKARAMLAAFSGVLVRVPHGTQTLILAALLTGEVSGAGAAAPNPVVPATLAAETNVPLTLAPGEHATVAFVLTLAAGYHVNARQVPHDYLIPTTATLASDLPAAVGPVLYPAPRPLVAGGEMLPVYEGAIHFEAPVVVAPSAAPGRYSLTLTLRFQPCSVTECLSPQEQSVTRVIEIAPLPANA